MSLAELLPDVRALPRKDKYRLIQLLACELEQTEEAEIVEGQSYPIWSPTDAFSAADALLKSLHASSGTK